MSLVYWLFRVHHITPGQWVNMGHGERDLIRAFAAHELEFLGRR